jgi:menaquinone-9 beta-reductase
MEYDVVVVGAGPAGSSAGYHLAKNGVRPLLLDRAEFPREKACGDGITPRAVRMLYEMGLRDRLEGSYRKMYGYRLSSGKHKVESRTPDVPGFPDHSYVIRRQELDSILLNHARAAGAEVVEGCKVEAALVEDGRVVGVRGSKDGRGIEVSARVVVGAGGARSIMGKSMDLLGDDPKSQAFAVRQYFEGVENTDDYLEMCCEPSMRPVLGWIFPVSEGIANVGIGAMVSHIQKASLNLNRVFEVFVNDTRMAERMLRGARPISTLRGAPLSWGLWTNEIEKPGLMLVGDAASLTNPLSGEGISYALESGQMASEHILESRENGMVVPHDPCSNPFRTKLVRRYQRVFKRSARLYRMVITRPILNPGLAIGSKLPGFGEFNFKRTLNMMKGS